MIRVLPTSMLMVFALASLSHATTVCFPREEMLKYMSGDFQASKQANGIVRPASLMELFVSDDDGAWFVVTTDLSGNSCIVAQGEAFNPSVDESEAGKS